MTLKEIIKMNDFKRKLVVFPLTPYECNYCLGQEVAFVETDKNDVILKVIISQRTDELNTLSNLLNTNKLAINNVFVILQESDYSTYGEHEVIEVTDIYIVINKYSKNYIEVKEKLEQLAADALAVKQTNENVREILIKAGEDSFLVDLVVDELELVDWDYDAFAAEELASELTCCTVE